MQRGSPSVAGSQSVTRKGGRRTALRRSRGLRSPSLPALPPFRRQPLPAPAGHSSGGKKPPASPLRLPPPLAPLPARASAAHPADASAPAAQAHVAAPPL